MTEISDIPARNYIPVKDVMTPAPHVIDGLATVQEAMALMRGKNVSSLIVDRRHANDEYGILVVHDVAKYVIGDDRSAKRTNVYEIMSKPVLSVDVAMDLKYAVRLLTRFGLSRALVVDHGEVAGIVTLRDMVFRFIPVDD